MVEKETKPGELRVALALRGGVSLAVWMGGACSEIDALRRSVNVGEGSDQRETVGDIYRRLLQAASYSSVSVDVVAGASAGGLNAVLMGCSVVHDIRFDRRIRNLWLELGDISKLTRSMGELMAESPLDGDGAFYKPLKDELLRWGIRQEPLRHPSRLDLSLTGTLLDARPNRRHQDLGEVIVETRNRARFRFRHLPMPPSLGFGNDVLSDFGTSDDRKASVERLAYAARATSSFPGAFEPASVGYSEDSLVPDGGAPPATHYGVFSESRQSVRPAAGHARDYVIDGGVLDNIPVGWAIRSIAAAPAHTHVDRWLVYLQPLGFDKVCPRDPGGRPPRARETAKRAMRLKKGTEKLADDFDELERVRADALRRAGVAQVLEYALGQVSREQELPEFLDQLFRKALAGVRAYRMRTNRVEQDRLRRLWTNPNATLGVDVLGYNFLNGINSDADTKSDRSALLADLEGREYEGVLAVEDIPNLENLQTDSQAVRRALCEVGRRLRTPQHLARTVAVLLDAARSLGGPGLEVKGSLYELRSKIELLIACHDRYLAAEPTRSGLQVGSNEMVRRAAWRLTCQRRHERDPWLPKDSLEVPDDVGWPEGALNDLTAQLVAGARELATAAQQVTDDGGKSGRAMVDCLIVAAGDAINPDIATEAVLGAVELLTGPLRPDPLAESGPIKFHMLSAARQSPRPDLHPGGDPDVDLGVNDKLAGNQVWNFGAFLSARWRLNDWTWGRLDAAMSLVDIVTHKAESDRLVAKALFDAFGGAGPSDSLPALRNRIVARLHERILSEELPLLGSISVRPPSNEILEGLTPDNEELSGAALLDVGMESVLELIARNPRLWGTLSKLGLVAVPPWGVDAVRAGVTWWRRRPQRRPSDQ